MPELFATRFAALDWVIVAVYLSLALVSGVLANRYVHDTAGYMVGGRGSGAALSVATYVGTGLGLVTLMYASIDAFTHGFAYVTLALIGAGVGVFLGSTGFVVSRLRRLELTTIPEYFERRFDRRTRITAGVICAVAGILNMGLFPKMGATFITYSTGLGGGDALAVNLVTSGLILLVLFYTVLGGMISVIVTDYVQFVILSISLAIGGYYVLSHERLGWSRMLESLWTHRGEAAFHPLAEGGYGWVWLLFNVLVFFAGALLWAPEASRALITTDERATRRMFLFAGPGSFVRLGLPALFAIAAFCWVSQDAALAAHFFPDGLSGEARHAEQALPFLIGTIVPSGVLGLLVAGLMAAFMSTHDSYLLCWASILTRDVIAPLKRRGLSEQQQIRTTRAMILAIGGFLLVWGVWYPLPDSVWNYMAVTSAIYLSGALPALVGGVYWSRASRAGAFWSLLAGVLSISGLFLGTLQSWLGDWVTAPLLGFSNFLFCIVVFVVVSLLRPDAPESVESDSTVFAFAAGAVDSAGGAVRGGS